MKGTVIIPRVRRDFEVAHRVVDGLHRIEVSVGSSFNELYWDLSADEFLAYPDYDDLKTILTDHGAEWLLTAIPQLASGALTSSELAEMAHRHRRPSSP